MQGLYNDELAILRQIRRRLGVSFIAVDDQLMEKKPFGRVVDVELVRPSEESPIVELNVHQHFGALCGVPMPSFDEEAPNVPCGLTPGHSGNHSPWEGTTV